MHSEDITVQVAEIALSVQEWDTILHWLTYGGDYHRAKAQEWLHTCVDGRMKAAKAAEHQKEAAVVDNLRKIVEEYIYPAPDPEPVTD